MKDEKRIGKDGLGLLMTAIFLQAESKLLIEEYVRLREAEGLPVDRFLKKMAGPSIEKEINAEIRAELDAERKKEAKKRKR